MPHLKSLLEQLFRTQDARALNREQELVLHTRQLNALLPSRRANTFAAQGTVEGPRNNSLGINQDGKSVGFFFLQNRTLVPMSSISKTFLGQIETSCCASEPVNGCKSLTSGSIW